MRRANGLSLCICCHLVVQMKRRDDDPAAVYAVNNSLRLHPAQVKLIQVSWNALLYLCGLSVCVKIAYSFPLFLCEIRFCVVQ